MNKHNFQIIEKKSLMFLMSQEPFDLFYFGQEKQAQWKHFRSCIVHVSTLHVADGFLFQLQKKMLFSISKRVV